MLYLLITICCLDADPFPRWIRDFHIKPKEWGGSSSEINAEDQAKQEAVVAECNVETVNKNPCQRSVAPSKLQIYGHNGGHSLHQSNGWTSSLLFFPFSFVTYYVYCLGSSALYYVFILFSFSVLHAYFCYFVCAYHMHFTWFLWLFATNLSCQHPDFSMPELQLQLCLDWDQHDWPFMPSIKSVSEHYLVCQVHHMTVSIVLDKDA